MKAAVVAYNICLALRHSKTNLKKNIFKSSVIYLQYNCLLHVHVFLHGAIHRTKLNIYLNNLHVLIKTFHNINTEVQSSNI